MALLVLPATLTQAEAPACARMLAQAVRAGAGALERFDSAALAVLLECRREALALGKTFRVQAMPVRLRELATLYLSLIHI